MTTKRQDQLNIPVMLAKWAAFSQLSHVGSAEKQRIEVKNYQIKENVWKHLAPEVILF
jgi:hypothetical protein